MGRFARALRKSFDQGPGTLAAGAHIFQLGTGRSNTGIQITTDRALGYSAFWGGVRILAESVAQVPLVIYKQLPNGGKEKARDHWLWPVLHDRPNTRQTSFRWRETGMTHNLTWGNTYCAIARDGMGRTKELWPLAPDRMQVRASSEDGQPEYHYLTQSNEAKVLGPRDVLHIPALAWDGLVGLSPIKYHRETIGLGLATEEHGGRFFSNGATSSFVLATDGKLSDTAIKHLREKIDTEKKGLQHAWDPWILEEGMKPIPITMPHDDAQWLQTRQHQVHEVARILRLPPYKLGVTDAGAVGYKSVEQFAIDFVVGSIAPHVGRWEQDLGMQLLGDDWTGAGGDYFVAFLLDGLLRGDIDARYKAYHQGIVDGHLLRSEVREMEDRNAIDGLDVPLLPMNTTTVNADGTSTMTTLTTVPAPGVTAP